MLVGYKNIRQFTIGALSMALIFIFQNCSDVKFSDQDGSLTKNGPPTPPLDGSPLNGLLQYEQPKAQITNKTDLLFIVDTSGSLDVERALIGDSILNFIGQLPAGSNVNIAVLLAHGSDSPYAGKLYTGKDSRASEPPVLKSSELSNSQLKALLQNKLKYIAGDSFTDGGEAGLFSLNQLMNPDQLQLAVSQGFFRSDAALAIVFVADENDICAVYPASITPVIDNEGNEPKAKAKLCGAPFNITAENTYAKIRSLKGDLPTLITGILYTDPADVPNGGENEVGYGYIDIIGLNDSTAITLTEDAAKMTEGLKKIGDMVTTKLNIKNIFSLKHAAIFDCPNQIINESIAVKVDGNIVPHTFSSQTCEVTLNPMNAGVASSQVNISYKYYPALM